MNGNIASKVRSKCKGPGTERGGILQEQETNGLQWDTHRKGGLRGWWKLGQEGSRVILVRKERRAEGAAGANN